MCGRFAFCSTRDTVAAAFGVAGSAEVEPHYNIAPTQHIPVVRIDAGGQRRLAMLQWGFVPAWAKARTARSPLINARAETLADKPSFRAAFRQRRCLVLANGWYEWQVTPGGKQPWYIRRDDGEPFAFAGLWERWPGHPGEAPLETCLIVTTAASGEFSALHERMPLVLSPGAFGPWLDAQVTDRARIAPLLGGELAAAAVAGLRAVRVSRRVNDVRNDGPGLTEEVPPAVVRGP